MDKGLVRHAVGRRLSGAQIPDARGVIVSGRDQPLPIRAEIGVEHVELLAEPLGDGLTVIHVPHLRGALVWHPVHNHCAPPVAAEAGVADRAARCHRGQGPSSVHGPEMN